MSDGETTSGENPVPSFRTHQVTPPPSLASNRRSGPDRFVGHFKAATKVDKKDEAKQVNALIYNVDDVGDDMNNNIAWSYETEWKAAKALETNLPQT